MRGCVVALSLLWLRGRAQESSQEIITLTGSNQVSSGGDARPTLSLSDFDGSSFATGTMSRLSSDSGATNATASTSAPSSSEEDPLTLIGGRTPTVVSGNMTVTATTQAPQPTNTQPCNNYPEFCNRKYSNITEVCAHNSPFVRRNNAGANQAYGVTQQLDDGIRMLQGQTHQVNGTMRYCHTSCDLLDAGTVEDYMREVTRWVMTHPFDVITIIIGNADYTKQGSDGKPLVTSQNYVEPIQNAGLMPYIYQPPKTAMNISDWPTLGQLILRGKRVIMFIDYNFDTDAVPWMLWQFYNIWETPYSPTDSDFPCTLDRPQGLSENKMKSMMYMANHNLNVEVSIAGLSLLIPNTVELEQTNGLNGTGSLGLQVEKCTSDWDRPPNFLLVDYYNAGPINGSVFEVAARANNVTYDRKCCGSESPASILKRPSVTYLGLTVVAVLMLML
ncbi:PLC-like phosphodiesterase [Polyplosphaeria fusca]|uniref:PLC-like phosphodiesterase n=1 Tax=Polyplosphaeria fusca TaxID=682080 RepID=A0A9P4V4M5_9PLEO|nr:PLC-like phosphodiesterase [Polyplosphaeria fusca]